ncbi:1852_t:CDS:2 [Dentiscutata erythropus]|uniref:1852_t:CDS:1 n=1 Tax=Dentiscutata erythropus TaxID=1348616 RepID=A0A9N9C747_9GLOM|nr:1852_t:CDS:2 [Dentiscutata erythropus]
MEGVIRQSTTAPKSTKIEIKSDVKNSSTSNKNRINLTPMKITQADLAVEIINTISNIKLEPQGNPSYTKVTGQTQAPTKRKVLE